MNILERITASLLGEDAGSGKKEPIVLSRRSGLYLKSVPPKGRGVFCKEDIKAGDIIEVAPAMVFNEADTQHVRRTLLHYYVFNAEGFPLPPALGAELAIPDTAKATCLALGIASFCNHLVHPNATMGQVADEDSPLYVLAALEDIPAGTEICINYGIAWPTTHRKS